MVREFSHFAAYTLLKLDAGTRLAGAVEFFIYDTIKIFLLLAVIIYSVSVIRSFFPPERTKRILSHKREFIGNILAALLGIVTPFCSCSAVPLFIGFVEAGVPLGVTFSFLISSPMVNEVAVVLLWGLFGWRIAAIYMSAGLSVAIIAGFIIGKLKPEKWVEEYVYKIQFMGAVTGTVKQTFKERLLYARVNTGEILQKVWLYVLIAVGIGGFIHGYVPGDFLVRYAGPGNPFGVPVAVALGVPLYSNAAGVIPIVYALMEKGMSMGTVLAFMMAVTALSLPEMIILRKVLKPRLLGVFAWIMTATIMAVGYLFTRFSEGALYMKIKVLGPGCANCHKLEETANAAVKALGLAAEVVKITDIGEIARHGILSTPGLIVNGKVKHTGKPLPSLEKVKDLIKGET